MRLQSSDPIGIFDSGLGGLTVAARIVQRMPDEAIIYFGDTAHLPWGDKSVQAIQSYALKICDFLLNNHCKCIVIACHTASTTAYEVVKEFVHTQTPEVLVINVIDPMMDQIQHSYVNQKIGLIGTKQTVRSNCYRQHIDALNQNIELVSLATPLLVPIIEEGFLESDIAHLVIREYLSHPSLANIEALILGCTHYPLLKQHIQAFYKKPIDILDASNATAEKLHAQLLAIDRLHTAATSDLLKDKSKKTFYLSDKNEFFEHNARLFFGSNIQVEHYPL
jgi:glutamate racemase